MPPSLLAKVCYFFRDGASRFHVARFLEESCAFYELLFPVSFFCSSASSSPALLGYQRFLSALPNPNCWWKGTGLTVFKSLNRRLLWRSGEMLWLNRWNCKEIRAAIAFISQALNVSPNGWILHTFCTVYVGLWALKVFNALVSEIQIPVGGEQGTYSMVEI